MAAYDFDREVNRLDAILGVGAPWTVTVACADCGAPSDPAAMWFVPRGTHPVHGGTRALCRPCRDRRVAAQYVESQSDPRRT